MPQEPQNKTWISCAAIAAVIIAAIIGLGVPFAERLADIYFPPPTLSVNLVAPTTDIGDPNVAPTSAPGSTPQVTVPILPSENPLCPFAVTQAEINSWKIGVADVATVQSYINQFDSARLGDAGAFKKGTTIPAGVVVATNFDEVDADKWSQYPVIAIVHSGSWGLFQTMGEYIAPNAGACRTIIP